jgi:type I restriction enzyme S subunit
MNEVRALSDTEALKETQAVPDGWTLLTFGDVADTYKGLTYATSNYSDKEKGSPFITLKCIKKNGGFSKRGLKYYDGIFKDHHIVKTGDVVFANTDLTRNGDVVGSPLRVPKLISDKPTLISMDLSKVVAKNGVDIGFIYFWLKMPFVKRYMINFSAGSTVLHLNTHSVPNIPVLTPSLPEQQKIAQILTSVDEVIEKTQAQIDKLKDLKSGMMQELLTKGIGHVEFKDSPVGSIPVGWEVVPLGDISRLSRGKFSHRPRNDPSFYNGLFPFLQTGDIPKETPYITNFTQSLNDKGLGVSKMFSVGTLVITIAATIGEIGVLKFASCFPDSLVGINVDNKYADSMYILYVMRHLKGELEALAPQTAQKNINLDILTPFLIPLPSLAEQKLISQSMESVDRSINRLKLKLQNTKNLKSALMQDLLTGKVRVNTEQSNSALMVG